MIRNRRARVRHLWCKKWMIDPRRIHGGKIHFTFDNVVTESGCVPRGLDKHGLALEAQKVYHKVTMFQTDWFPKSILTEILEDKDV